MLKRNAWVFVLLAGLCGGVSGQVPSLINYQGRLLNDTNLVSGNVELVLSLYDAASSGDLVYEDSNTVAVVDGLYSTFIGDDPSATSGPLADALTNEMLYVEVAVNGVTLSPRERIVAVGYAMVAGGVVDGAITAGKVDAATFSNTFWKVDGNAGTDAGTHFIGTADNQGFEIQVFTQRVVRYEPDSIGPRVVAGKYSTVGGSASTVAGGYNNNASTNYAAICGGRGNDALNYDAFIGGGSGNEASGIAAVVGGGENNRSLSRAAVVGGAGNQAQGSHSFVGGGRTNTILSGASCCVIGGGGTNTIEANALDCVIVGGKRNRVGEDCEDSVIAGGYWCEIDRDCESATISGGGLCKIGSDSDNATVGGGSRNTIYGRCGSSTIAGGYLNVIATNSGSCTISGGSSHRIWQNCAGVAIAGGYENRAYSNSRYTVFGGGYQNIMRSNCQYSVIGGGRENILGDSSEYAFIGSGYQNEMGESNQYCTIGGGASHLVGDNAEYVTIPGGYNNVAEGQCSFAAGNSAMAVHDGAFVWACNRSVLVSSTNTNQVTFHASGGVRMFTDAGATAGAQLEPNATAWTVLSDRNMKQNIVPLNGRDVVEALSDIPICEWSFKHDPAHRRYYGPMAQDFFDGFHLGTDNRHINSGDLDGVALAAIQGLYQMVKDLEEENRSIRAELEAFKSRNR